MPLAPVVPQNRSSFRFLSHDITVQNVSFNETKWQAMNSNPLERMQLRTRELTALKLRSAATVMAALHALILESHRFGYSHPSIHAALRAGGLGVTWNTYRSALRRLRRKAEATAPPRHGTPASPVPTPGSEVGAVQPAADIVGLHASPAPASTPDASSLPATSSATNALAALQALQGARACGGRDYAQVARALHKGPRP
jgi:hypothetical protein